MIWQNVRHTRTPNGREHIYAWIPSSRVICRIFYNTLDSFSYSLHSQPQVGGRSKSRAGDLYAGSELGWPDHLSHLLVFDQEACENDSCPGCVHAATGPLQTPGTISCALCRWISSSAEKHSFSY